MRGVRLAAVGLVLVAFVASLAHAGPQKRPDPSTMPLEKLAAEYRQLRELDRLPMMKTEDQRQDLEYWGGRMQAVMNELGKRLGAKGTPRKRLLELMGPPDQIAHKGDPSWSFPWPRGATEICLYWWRHHDLLYFELNGDAVARSEWWMPGE